MRTYPSDVAFTPAVKAVQSEKGSRPAYARGEEGDGWQTTVTPGLAEYLGDLDMFYLATATAGGQPYVQYRGGPPGFLKVLDEHTLAFADFGGNRQYLTVGNLSENPRAFLFLVDYANRRRVKLWGTARVVEGDAALLDRLSDPAYPGRVERAVVVTVAAWDVNCPQHIHRRLTERQIASLVEGLRARITSAAGASRFGRFRLRPAAGTAHLAPEQAAAKPADFLAAELPARLAAGPAVFRVVVQAAEPGDEVADATLVWPETRPEVAFGTLTIRERVDELAPERRRVIFDPVPRVDGIGPAGDPLTDVRSEIYLLSGRRRRAAAR